MSMVVVQVWKFLVENFLLVICFRYLFMFFDLIFWIWLFLLVYWKSVCLGSFWVLWMIFVRCGLCRLIVWCFLFFLWNLKCINVLCILMWWLCSVLSLNELFCCVYFLLFMWINVVFSKCVIVVRIFLWFNFGCFNFWFIVCWIFGSIWLKVIMWLYFVWFCIFCYCGW